MTKKILFISLLALGFLLQGVTLWADDDAIMDVDNNAAAFFGFWGTSTNKILFYGDNYRWALGAGRNVSTPTRTATFTTARVADITGLYEVYVRWTRGNDREESAVYRIYDGSTATFRGSCSHNQTLNGGAWNYCATVTLTAGNRGIVVLGNEFTDTNEVVIADGVRFVRTSFDSDNLVGVDLRQAGLDWVTKNSRGIADISTSTASRTNLTFDSITAPSGGTGYVIVKASGWAQLTSADRQVSLCIDNASGGSGCDSHVHYLENNTDEVNSANFENRKEFSIQEVYSIAGGTTATYYLKAARESGATGTIVWDDFVLLYVPRFY
jgi:hypothetical protein